MKDGLNHGFGKEIWPDSSRYEGDCEGKKHGKGTTYGLTRVSMMETGMRIGLKATALIHGLTVDSIQDLGRTTICMGMECILGETVGDMRATTRWIRSMAMESTPGLMAEGMKAIGSMASNMAKANTFCQTEV